MTIRHEQISLISHSFPVRMDRRDAFWHSHVSFRLMLRFYIKLNLRQIKTELLFVNFLICVIVHPKFRYLSVIFKISRIVHVDINRFHEVLLGLRDKFYVSSKVCELSQFRGRFWATFFLARTSFSGSYPVLFLSPKDHVLLTALEGHL